MRKQLLVFISLVLAFSNSAAIMSRDLAGAVTTDYGNPNITLCHANRDPKKPYTTETVDADSIFKRHGHDSHDSHYIATSEAVADSLKAAKDYWGDIIPSFYYGFGLFYSGLNYNSQTADMVLNGCGYVSTVNTEPVVFVDGACDVVASYTIPATVGVDYFIGTTKQVAGLHTVSTSGAVAITAAAAVGYTLSSSATTAWNFTFTIPDPASCVLGAESVRPLAVTFIDNNCEVQASYTVPITTGVTYYIGDAVVAAGTYTVDTNKNITVKAVANEGYIIDDGAAFQWSHDFVIPSYEQCHPDVSVVPETVTFIDNTCEVSASYTIPTTTGVTYYIGDTVVAVGTYTVDTNKNITVIAVANEGYVIETSAISQWSHDFVILSYEQCHPDISVVPEAVTFVDIACDTVGSYTIPAVAGVKYYVGEVLTAAGTYEVSTSSTVNITAVADEGYVLGDATASWTHTFTALSAGQCVLGTVSTTPSPVAFTAPTCTALGYYTIPTTTGIEYYVDGKVVLAGIHRVQNGKTVIVTAVAGLDYEIKAGATSSWKYTFVAPVNCIEEGAVLGASTVASLPLTSTQGIDPVVFAIFSFISIVTILGIESRRLYEGL